MSFSSATTWGQHYFETTYNNRIFVGYHLRDIFEKWF